MSNVRPRNAMPRTMSAFVHRPAANEKLGSQHCRASSPWPWLRRAIRPLAAGEPSSLDRRSNSFPLAPPRTRAPGTNAFRSPAALQALPRVNVGQFVGSGAVAPVRSARSRSQWCRLQRSGRAVVASAIHELRQRGLTLPSRGRATSGFASCRPPLMSNVRRAFGHALQAH